MEPKIEARQFQNNSSQSPSISLHTAKSHGIVTTSGMHSCTILAASGVANNYRQASTIMTEVITIRSVKLLDKINNPAMASIQQVSDGLRKQLIQEGGPVRPNPGDTITVECTGNLGDGTGQGNITKKFWSTSDPGQKPFTFQVGIGQVIKGWDEGCMTMSQGERANLIVAGFKGYGKNGFPAWGIPPDAELIFQMHVLSIERKR